MGYTAIPDYTSPDFKRIFGPKWIGYRPTYDLPAHANSQYWVNFLAWIQQDGFNQKLYCGGRPPWYSAWVAQGKTGGVGDDWTGDYNWVVNHDEFYEAPWDCRSSNSADLTPYFMYSIRGISSYPNTWVKMPNPWASGKSGNPHFRVQGAGMLHHYNPAVDGYVGCPADPGVCQGMAFPASDMHCLILSRRDGVYYQSWQHDYVNGPWWGNYGSDQQTLKNGNVAVAKWFTKRMVNDRWQYDYRKWQDGSSGTTDTWGAHAGHWGSGDGQQQFGATVAGGLPIAPFMVGFDEAKRGTIKHMMVTTILNAASTAFWPCFGSDGDYTDDPVSGTPSNKTIDGGTHACLPIPYGSIIRLKRNDTVNAKIRALRTGGYRLAHAVAVCYQDYGLMTYDKASSRTPGLLSAAPVEQQTGQWSGLGPNFHGDKRWPDNAQTAASEDPSITPGDGVWAFTNVSTTGVAPGGPGFNYNDIEVVSLTDLMVSSTSMESAF